MKNREFLKKVTQYIRDEMNALTNEELNQVVDECNALTSTNCDWLEYEIRNVLSRNANALLYTREYWKTRNDIVVDNNE